MKPKILIGTHGRFGEELVKSAELIVGSLNEIVVFSLESHVSADEYRATILNKLSTEEHYVCLVDLFGGTPCNVFLSLINDYNLEILCGVNLPMLIELVTMTGEEDISQLKKHILEIYRNSGFDVKDRFMRRGEIDQ